MIRRPQDLPGDLPGPDRPRRADRRDPDAVDGPTVLAVPLRERMFRLFGGAALGVLLALVLPPFARWALGWERGLPIRPVFRGLGAIDRPWEIVLAIVVGLLLGLAAAAVALGRTATLTLTESGIRVDRDERSAQVERADVAAAFLDGKRLVILDHESRQLVREDCQAPAPAIAQAFRAHSYPWRDADPYAELYRRWVPDTAELPAEVNAVLAARQAALKKKAAHEVRTLRDAAQRLGFTVREEGARQFWRPLVRS